MHWYVRKYNIITLKYKSWINKLSLFWLKHKKPLQFYHFVGLLSRQSVIGSPNFDRQKESPNAFNSLFLDDSQFVSWTGPNDWSCSIKPYLDSSTSTFSNGVRYGSSGWIYHRHETNKSEASQGEVGVIRVILVAWRVLVNGQNVVTESCKNRAKLK